MEATHRKVITTVHERWSSGSPFAIHEVQAAANVSRSTTIRVMRILVRLNLVEYRESRAYKGRQYRVSVRWPTSVSEVIENFEIAKALNL